VFYSILVVEFNKVSVNVTANLVTVCAVRTVEQNIIPNTLIQTTNVF